MKKILKSLLLASCCYSTAVFAEESPQPNFMEAMGGMMESDAMKSMMKMQIERLFTELWTPFANKLDSAIAPKFKSTILEAQVDQASQAMKMMSKSSEERKVLADDMQKKTDQLESDIKTLLGDEAIFAAYTAYKSTLGARTKLFQFKQQALFEVSDDQGYEMLVQVMADVDKEVGAPMDQQGLEMMNAGFDEKSVEKLISQNKKANEMYISRSQSILSVEEWAKFKSALQSQEQMMEMGMKMMPAMMKMKKMKK